MNEQLNTIIRLVDRLKAQIEHANRDDVIEGVTPQTAMEKLRVAEEQLQEQNQTLCAAFVAVEAERMRHCDLFELAPDGYIVTDGQGTILKANKAMGDMSGADVATLINKPIATLFPVEEGLPFRDFFLRVRSGAAAVEPQIVWQKELLMRLKNLTPVLARCSVSSRPSDSETTMRWIFRDLTDQKRAEADIKRANQTLETSVHDRTILLEEKISELESFHDVVVGRELRLVELEQEVERLRQRLARYELKDTTP